MVKGQLLPSFLVKFKKKDPLFYHLLLFFSVLMLVDIVFVIRIAFLHRERCHKRADTDSVFSHTIFHCACSSLSLFFNLMAEHQYIIWNY